MGAWAANLGSEMRRRRVETDAAWKKAVNLIDLALLVGLADDGLARHLVSGKSSCTISANRMRERISSSLAIGSKQTIIQTLPSPSK